MGYAWVIVLVLVTAAAFWWFGRLRGASLQLALAALMVGGAGYALQGRPALQGAPKAAGQRAAPLPLTRPRQAMFGQFSAADRWLIIADSYESRGNTADAVGIIKAGLRAHPNDPALLTGLGNVLVDHAGMLTPAATMAFERARRAAPQHPAPLFFHGLALARSEEREQALALWQQALTLTPPNASYRPFIAEGIAALTASPPPPR